MEFKHRIETDDLLGDLIFNSYIKPKDILVHQVDIDELDNAIEIIRNFISAAESANVIDYH